MDGRLAFGTYDVNGSIIACDRTRGMWLFFHIPDPLSNTVDLRNVFAALPFHCVH